MEKSKDLGPEKPTDLGLPSSSAALVLILYLAFRFAKQLASGLAHMSVVGYANLIQASTYSMSHLRN